MSINQTTHRMFSFVLYALQGKVQTREKQGVEVYEQEKLLELDLILLYTIHSIMATPAVCVTSLFDFNIGIECAFGM